jgi:hypothetical protein
MQMRMRARLTKLSWMSRRRSRYGESAKLVEQGEGLCDDVAQLAQALDAGSLGLGMIGSVPRSRHARRKAWLLSLVGQQGVEVPAPAPWQYGLDQLPLLVINAPRLAHDRRTRLIFAS